MSKGSSGLSGLCWERQAAATSPRSIEAVEASRLVEASLPTLTLSLPAHYTGQIPSFLLLRRPQAPVLPLIAPPHQPLIPRPLATLPVPLPSLPNHAPPAKSTATTVSHILLWQVERRGKEEKRKRKGTYQLSTANLCSRLHHPQTILLAHSPSCASASSWHRSHAYTFSQHPNRNQR